MKNKRSYEEGEWDMFELVTSVFFCKQFYFLQEDGTVYSRLVGKRLSREEAIKEFLEIIAE